MIILVILVILTCVLVIIAVFMGRNSSWDFDTGVAMGIIIAILIAFDVCLFVTIIEPKPSALDVYRGKTELEITSVNGVPTDTVVVFKN